MVATHSYGNYLCEWDAETVYIMCSAFRAVKRFNRWEANTWDSKVDPVAALELPQNTEFILYCNSGCFKFGILCEETLGSSFDTFPEQE
eukprot:1119100-Pyramimonas_sp.AAC.4